MAGNSPNRVYLVVAVVSVAIVTTAAFAFVQSRKAKQATKDKKKIEKVSKDIKLNKDQVDGWKEDLGLKSGNGSGGKGESKSENTTSEEKKKEEEARMDQAEKKGNGRKWTEESTTATALYKEGKYREAADQYTIAIDLALEQRANPKDLKVLYGNRAATHEKLELRDKVVEDCTSALKYDVRYLKAIKRRALAQEDLGKLRQALIDFTTAWVVEQQNGHAVQAAQMQYEIERSLKKLTLNEAKSLWAARENEKKTLPATFFITAYLASFHDNETGLDEEELSVEGLSEALKDPAAENRPELLYKRSIALTKEKRYEEALEDVEKAVKSMSKKEKLYPCALRTWATFLHLQGYLDKARTALEESLEYDDKSLIARVKLAGIAFDREDLKKAMDYFDRARELNPESPDVLFHRAQMLMLQDRPQEVVKDFETCIDLAPKFAMAHVLLGIVHSKLGNMDQAIKCCRKASQILPELPEVHNYHGEMLLATEKYDEAYSKFEEAAKVDPKCPLPVMNMGIIRLRARNDPAGAVDMFQKAIEIDPHCQMAYIHLAQLCLQTGEAQTAMDQFDLAIANARSEQEISEVLAFKLATEAQIEAASVLMANKPSE